MYYLVTKDELETLGSLHGEGDESLAFLTWFASMAVSLALGAAASEPGYVPWLAVGAMSSVAMALYFGIRWRKTRGSARRKISRIVDDSMSPKSDAPAMTWGQLLEFIATRSDSAGEEPRGGPKP